MLTGSLAFNATDSNNVLLFLTRQHQIDPEGHCFVHGSWMFMDAVTGEIHSVSCKFKFMKHKETKDAK